MTARLGTVKLLKDLHVGGMAEPVFLTEATGLVWDTRDGVYAKLTDVDLTETHILQGWSQPAPRYDTKIFHHWKYQCWHVVAERHSSRSYLSNYERCTCSHRFPYPS